MHVCVLCREGDGVLGVELYCAGENGVPDLCIEQELISSGVLVRSSTTRASRAKANNAVNSSALIMRPG